MQAANQQGRNFIPAHEKFISAGLLAAAGGFLDAYTYLLRGRVFANAQTGNMVLVAVGLAKGDILQALFPVIPIVAFMFGVIVAEGLKIGCQDWRFPAHEPLVLVAEILLLFIIGWLPMTVRDAVVNVTISFICSIQVCSFRKVRGMAYASTMCTGNLRSGTEQLFIGISYKSPRALKNAAHYFGIILLFIAGAFMGGILSKIFGVRSIWFCCILLAAVLGTGYFSKNSVPD